MAQRPIFIEWGFIFRHFLFSILLVIEPNFRGSLLFLVILAKDSEED